MGHCAAQFGWVEGAVREAVPQALAPWWLLQSERSRSPPELSPAPFEARLPRSEGLSYSNGRRTGALER